MEKAEEGVDTFLYSAREFHSNSCQHIETCFLKHNRNETKSLTQPQMWSEARNCWSKPTRLKAAALLFR